jgi:hypothetical protein
MAASLGLDASHLCACTFLGVRPPSGRTRSGTRPSSASTPGPPLTVREDNIDLGEGIIPIHILNLTCAVHLRQEHGFKRWQISRFLETYPWLIREDGTFAFAALHRLVHVMVHVEEAAVPLDESGTVAFVRLIKPPGVTDHLNP